MTAEPRSNRRGLILAAGLGSRLTVDGEMVLKPLLPVGGRALILRALDNLRSAGCDEAVIVVGYQAETVERCIRSADLGGLALHFVFNDRYDLHNGVSVLAARELLTGDFVLAMADHIFDPGVGDFVASLRCPSAGASLLVDYKLESVLDIDDATKVVVQDDRIVSIGKSLKTYNAVDCGLFLAGPALLEALERVYASTGNASLSDGVQVLASAGQMHAVDIGDRRWQDVDDLAMLRSAERLVAYPPTDSAGTHLPERAPESA